MVAFLLSLPEKLYAQFKCVSKMLYKYIKFNDLALCFFCKTRICMWIRNIIFRIQICNSLRFRINEWMAHTRNIWYTSSDTKLHSHFIYAIFCTNHILINPYAKPIQRILIPLCTRTIYNQKRITYRTIAYAQFGEFFFA